MRYFTPELYKKLNSEDNDVADIADAEWEVASAMYSDELKSIDIKPLHYLDSICLHDAFVVKVSFGENTIVISAELAGTIYVIVYENATYVIDNTHNETKISNEFVHPKDRQHLEWMYDEIDVEGDKFVHRIMFNNLGCIDITFTNVIVQRLTLGITWTSP